MTEPFKTHRQRREELMRTMRGGIAIVPTAPQHTRNNDVLFPFRPDSDFYYLTHFPEPEAIAVLMRGEFLLFCRERDADKEVWDGRRAGTEGACERYGADQSFPIDQIDQHLPALLADIGDAQVFTTMGRYPEFDAALTRWVGEVRAKQPVGVHAPAEFVDLGRALHEMRMIKKPDEQSLMRRAARLSAMAHRRAMRAAAPGRYEYQVQAELECAFRLGGSASPAYPSIVAGGANACILHYTNNDCALRDGDLLLVDAGAELDCYAADITRTFPVNGVFSGEQRAVYEIVLAAQRAAIAAVAAGQPMTRYHDAAMRVLADGLIELGLVRGERDELIQSQSPSLLRFTLHRAGHWLGMDVHDVGDYKIDGEWRTLQPGMVLTVEPGLYIPAADDVDPRWHDIGVRIEDDILIMPDGNENLSADAPKEIADIESLMANGDDAEHESEWCIG